MEKTRYYLTRAEIMRRAHAAARAAQQPGDSYAVTLGEALRLAWAEARQPQTLEQFHALPGEQQLQILRRFAARCPEYAQRQTRRDPETGEKIPAPARWAEWMTPASRGGMELEPWAVAVDTIAAEAWTGLDRQPEDLPLGIILARAARAACQRLSRLYRDAPQNRNRSRTQDGTGAIMDAVSLDDPDYTGAAHYPSPEAATITREAVRTAARDDIDLLILDLRAQGYTLQDCARAAGMSHPAVIKRLQRMQQRMEDAKTEQDANDLDAAVMAAAGVRRPRPKTWSPDNAASSAGQP